MRCTPDPGGCASCLSLNIPCKVTDRVTGETLVRGEAGQMRAIIESLKKQIEDLKEQTAQLQRKNAQLQDCVDGAYRANLMDHYEVWFCSRFSLKSVLQYLLISSTLRIGANSIPAGP